MRSGGSEGEWSRGGPPGRSTRRGLLRLALVASLVAPGAGAAGGPGGLPDVLLICVDTLQADRLSAYGYSRPTSPVLDGLLAQGAIFRDARTVEPLTGPASVSMITSRFPHEHGATRNGLRMRPGMTSLSALLRRRGYETAALVGNWSLKDSLTGLSEHFDLYREVFSRKQLFGLFNSEASGEDLTGEALRWIERRGASADRRRPYFLWVHYVEPHSPYLYWEELAHRLGLDDREELSKSDLYDTEVAFVDREIGRLLGGLAGPGRLPDDTVVIFVADHGESLGDHDYWGHGSYVYDNSLRIPMGIVWPGHVPAGAEIRGPALNIDLAPTVLGLLGLPASKDFLGHDWSQVLRGAPEPEPDRSTYFQAHKGTVLLDHTSEEARLEGLLEVGRVTGDRKEVLDLRDETVRIYDLRSDPGERADLAPAGARPSPELLAWLSEVLAGLGASSDLPPPDVDEESLDRLRSLGYVD